MPTPRSPALETLRPATLRETLDTAVLRTRALHALRSADAEAALGETISSARREGFVLALVDGMPELGPRVSFHLRSGPIGVFERAVLDRLDRPRSAPTRSETSEPVEPLTAREMTILRYLDSRLTANEIATGVLRVTQHGQDPREGGVPKAGFVVAPGSARRSPAPAAHLRSSGTVRTGSTVSTHPGGTHGRV